MPKLFFNTRDEMTCIDDYLIAYCKANGNYTIVQLITGKEMVLTQTLSRVMKLLEEPNKVNGRFIRVGRSFIINQDYIYKIFTIQHKLILSDGLNWTMEIQMSKSNLKSLQSEMIERNQRLSVTGRKTTPNKNGAPEVPSQLVWDDGCHFLRIGQNWIGRTDWEIMSDLMVDDEFISRRSAYIEVNESNEGFVHTFTLQRSTNPVKIDGKSVRVGDRVVIQIGSKIAMGNTIFELKPIEKV